MTHLFLNETGYIAVDELIVSAMHPADGNARKQVLKLLPGLIAELRKGLKQIACDKPAQPRFFKDLAVRIHYPNRQKGKNGVKITEIQASQLAEELRRGQAAIVKINEKTLTERGLSELMGL
ncbi:uncharacterized protein DUF1631 [Methylobacter tundripaludum]|uniref:Uncharacterized protein DUF1631 n=1 Tax=Methylobacter tundripaludum TaxID=173365 RepID=A0A2S6H419_9GAMM|nr:DUF1631 family protein [Methylobacter tundripaludum]PPK72225.1 uncharacterized protein DUF1631 [Methylobacter tundripaludum]